MNSTKQWTFVDIDGEEITCTPGHKFFLPNNKNNRDLNEELEHESYKGLGDKWVSAKDLKPGDVVLLANGSYGKIDSVVTQDLEVLETTYNFEVEDYHTYYVGKKGTLVHNMNCNLERVGRWMSKDEYNAMVDTGVVQEGACGVTYVARPADITAYASQSRSGSVYVEFDVPISSLRSTQAGWGKIIGPNSIDTRLMISK